MSHNSFHHKLGPPSQPSGLTAQVNKSSVELNWNAASADEDVDFYRVAVYRMESGIPIILHESLEKDTHEHIILYRITGVFIANVSSCNRCGQMSQGNASMVFEIQGEYINHCMYVHVQLIPFVHEHHCV